VAAQAALPASPLQKRQENEPLRSRSLRLAKYLVGVEKVTELVLASRQQQGYKQTR
jgi:hypothetical protein